jgi:hypothetical protein
MRRRTAASVCALALVAAATLPASVHGAPVAPARTCAPFDDFLYEQTDFDHSQMGRFRVTATGVSCRSARRIVIAFRLHARVRPGWTCAAADAEAACTHGSRRAASLLSHSIGSGCGVDGELQMRASIGKVWAAHLTCTRALAVLRAWVEASPRPVAPEGFTCRRLAARAPSTATHYYCRARGALLRFGVGAD